MSPRRVLAAAPLIIIMACARHALRVPDGVRGYEIVVDGRDTLSLAFVKALEDEGLRVRVAPRGGSRPAAVLVHFVFRDRPDGPAYLYARLADTRTGRIVAAASQPLDSANVAFLVSALLAPLP